MADFYLKKNQMILLITKKSVDLGEEIELSQNLFVDEKIQYFRKKEYPL